MTVVWFVLPTGERVAREVEAVPRDGDYVTGLDERTWQVRFVVHKLPEEEGGNARRLVYLVATSMSPERAQFLAQRLSVANITNVAATSLPQDPAELQRMADEVLR